MCAKCEQEGRPEQFYTYLLRKTRVWEEVGGTPALTSGARGASTWRPIFTTGVEKIEPCRLSIRRFPPTAVTAAVYNAVMPIRYVCSYGLQLRQFPFTRRARRPGLPRVHGHRGGSICAERAFPPQWCCASCVMLSRLRASVLLIRLH